MPTKDARISQVRGFAWYIFRDPMTSTGPAGSHPFGAELPEGEPIEGEGLPIKLPEGVVDAWRTTITLEGLENRSPGTAFLVLTETRNPPQLNAGWDCEPAVLHPDFQLEQKGDRWVRLARVVTAPPEGGKALGEYEFEIDRNWQGSGRDRG